MLLRKSQSLQLQSQKTSCALGKNLVFRPNWWCTIPGVSKMQTACRPDLVCSLFIQSPVLPLVFRVDSQAAHRTHSTHLRTCTAHSVCSNQSGVCATWPLLQLLWDLTLQAVPTPEQTPLKASVLDWQVGSTCSTDPRPAKMGAVLHGSWSEHNEHWIQNVGEYPCSLWGQMSLTSLYCAIFVSERKAFSLLLW